MTRLEERPNAVDATHGDMRRLRDLAPFGALPEDRFRAAFAHASVGMAITTLEGRFLHVNPALCEITGYREAELLATDFQSITHPADLPAQLASIERMRAGDIPGFVI